MTSLEKFNFLVELEKKDTRIKVTTFDGSLYYCKLHCPAEDEDDWAYIFVSPDFPTHYFILECNFIERIEEITEAEWQSHLKEL